MLPTSCDTMVALSTATANGQTLFAKNSDRPPDECQPLVLQPRRTPGAGTQTRCQFVEVPEVDVTYRHVGSRPHWCWGYEHGFNEHQVVIGNEALPSRLPDADEAKLVGMELIRLGLERGRTAEEAVQVITDLVDRYGQGKFANDEGVTTYDNGYIVADPGEAYVVETAGHQWAVKQVRHAVGISNIYSLEEDWDRVSPGAETDATGRGWRDPDEGRFNFAAAYAQTYDDPTSIAGSGDSRRRRSCALLGDREGGIDVRTMMDILRDHGGSEHSLAGAGDSAESPADPAQFTICMHVGADGTGSNTAASLVADLCGDGSRLPVYWCSFYSPCLGVFLPIFVEGDLPAELSTGGPRPEGALDAESPWWLFHRLTHLSRSRPEPRVPLVRKQWASLQAQLLETAYPMAQEGRRLLDAGQADQASRLLSSYMAKNVTTVLRAAREVVRRFEESGGEWRSDAEEAAVTSAD